MRSRVERMNGVRTARLRDRRRSACSSPLTTLISASSSAILLCVTIVGQPTPRTSAAVRTDPQDFCARIWRERRSPRRVRRRHIGRSGAREGKVGRWATEANGRPVARRGPERLAQAWREARVFLGDGREHVVQSEVHWEWRRRGGRVRDGRGGPCRGRGVRGRHGRRGVLGRRPHTHAGRLEARGVVDVGEPCVQVIRVARLEEVLAAGGRDETEDVLILRVGLRGAR